MVTPVKLRLAKHEARRLVEYFNIKIEGKLNSSDVRNDLIVMAEFYEKLFLKATRQQLKPGHKPTIYHLPLSIARILHNRLQQEPCDSILQNILYNLDHELTNINMAPKFSKQLSI